MAIDKNNYHITLKNLRTGVLQGFMLAGGDTPYMVQGVDNIAQRIADGEILYSDFTNSRVFAQENWSEGTTKFWDPEKNGYYIFPSRKYKDKKSIRILNNGSEFTLGSKLSEVYTYTNPQLKGPMCRGESGGVVYMGDGMKLYRSSDYGTTWSIFKDFTAEKYLTGIVNEITDIKLISTVAPFTMSYTGEMASMTLATMKQIWVCFYNRSTKHTEVARYDIDYGIKGFSGSTFKKSYSGTINAAFGSKRDTLKVDTTIPTEEIQGFLHQYTYNSSTKTFFFVSSGTAASNKLFPGQKFKARRNATGAIYNCTVMSWGGWFNSGGSSPTEMNISGIPSFSSTSAENYYTIYDIGKTGSLCLPITEGGIESIIAVGLGLGQTFDYMGERFFIDGLSNGITNFGNQIGNYTETYQPAGSIVATDYAIISKVGGGDVYGYIANQGTQTFTLNNWITSLGNYSNNCTKFVNVSGNREHLWGVNDIDPHEKLYDIGYGEVATNVKDSMIYNMSYAGGISSPQNHTYEFYDGICPISGLTYPPGQSYGVMRIGTQNIGEGGTEARLLRFGLNDNQTKPSYTETLRLGVNGISCITYFQDILYFGTKDTGEVYEYTVNASSPVVTKLAQLPLDKEGKSYIDDITNYGGNIVCSNQWGAGVYTFELSSRKYNESPLIEVEPLCGLTGVENKRIYNICNTGGRLLFSCEDGKIYSYDVNNFADEGYLESSIYGGYISNIEKSWVYGYVRMNKLLANNGEKVGLQVSFDQCETWHFVPTKKGKEFSNVLDWNNSDYFYSYTTGKEQLTFIFPYNTKSSTIAYRCWLKKGNLSGPVITHIGIHYNLNYKQEFLFNYQIDLNKSFELLNGREVEKDKQNDKLLFLKDIWQNQDMVELIDVTGAKYTCIPFSDDRTPGQGLVISTANANGAIKDLDNLVYKVAFGLKTIANYEKIL